MLSNFQTHKKNCFFCSYSYLCGSVHYNFGSEEIARDLSDQSFKCISEQNEKSRTQTTKCYLGIFLHTLSWSGFRLICVTYWCNTTQFVRLKASGVFFFPPGTYKRQNGDLDNIFVKLMEIIFSCFICVKALRTAFHFPFKMAKNISLILAKQNWISHTAF